MQRIDGLWTVEGLSLEGATSGGVLVFCHGQVFGGGDRYYCIGTYSLSGAFIDIEARIFHFHGAVHSRVAGNKPDFHLHFRGGVLTEVIEGQVNRADDHEVNAPLKLIWRAPLPL
jgi:hypothetical protein